MVPIVSIIEIIIVFNGHELYYSNFQNRTVNLFKVHLVISVITMGSLYYNLFHSVM